jgi:hypothetical protein
MKIEFEVTYNQNCYILREMKRRCLSQEQLFQDMVDAYIDHLMKQDLKKGKVNVGKVKKNCV